MTARYGCHNRAPFEAHWGQDGRWIKPGYVLIAKAVIIPQTMAKDCQYTLSELGKTDPRCDGCKHKS